MSEYLKFLDLKEIINGIIGGAILLGIVAAWVKFTVKGTAFRVRNNEAYATKLAILAASDVALMIYGFQGIFAVIGLLCLILAIQDLAFTAPDPYAIELKQFLKLVVWLLPAVVCAGFFRVLQNVSDYPQSIEKVEKKIEKLKDRISRAQK